MDWAKFFSMGGYALYVWGSYGLTLMMLAGEVLMLWKRKRNLARRENPEGASAEAQLNTSFQGVQ